MRKIVLFLFIMPGCAIGYLNAQFQNDVPSNIKDPDPIQTMEQDFLSENDGGLYTEGAIPTYQCTGTISPSVQIVNYGSNLLTSAKLEYSVDAGTLYEYIWSGSLEPGALDTIHLPAITVTAGSHMLSVSITQANGSADINGGNNNGTVDFFIVGTSAPAPVSEEFNAGILPEGYFIENPDGDFTWEVYFDDEVTGPHNYMMQMPFYHSYDYLVDHLYLKNLDLSNSYGAFMTFDVAYVYYSPQHFDQLRILASSDCGNDWDVLYDKEKDELATTSIEDNLPYGDIEFFPVNPSQWRNEWIDLGNYSGNSNVMIRFEGISGHGNNLYIDNIKISATVGINEANLSQIGLHVYPNPANDQVILKLDGHVSDNSVIRAVNVLGQNMYTSPIHSASPFFINTGNWPAGVYIINLLDGNTIICREQLSVVHH